MYGSQPAITYSKLTIETLKQGVKQSTPCSSVSIVNFQQLNAGWGIAETSSSTQRENSLGKQSYGIFFINQVGN